MVDCAVGEGETLSAEFFFDRYQGDWNALLTALFSADIPKVSHNVKDLMRTLLENGLPAEGFTFDTALAAYLIDATSGKYDLPTLFTAYFHGELPAPVHLSPDAFSLLGDAAAAETAAEETAKPAAKKTAAKKTASSKKPAAAKKTTTAKKTTAKKTTKKDTKEE